MAKAIGLCTQFKVSQRFEPYAVIVRKQSPFESSLIHGHKGHSIGHHIFSRGQVQRISKFT